MGNLFYKNTKRMSYTDMSKEENNLPCCKGSWTDVSETVALICFILNVVSPGFGTFIACLLDKKGCNMTAFMVCCAQGLLTIVVVGWIWSILHGLKLYQGSKGKQ